MKNKRKWCAAFTSVMLSLTLCPASSAQANLDKPQPFVESALGATANELIIAYKAGADLTKVAGRYQGKIEKIGKQINKLRTGVVQLSQSADKTALIAALQADPDVEYVQPNYLYQAASATNDPHYSKQWNLNAIKADQAWATSTGGSVPIAVVDTGVSSRDEDLKANLLPGINTINDTTNTEDDSSTLHGTKVAGTIAAQMNNGLGTAGVAPASKIIPVKALGANGLGTDIDIADGIIWAADHGAKIINLSFSRTTSSNLITQATGYAIDKGAVVVAAAGNDTNTEPLFSAHPALTNVRIISVGATMKDNTKAIYSVDASNWLDLMAPGDSIPATDGSVSQGTSFSAAQVSGAAALLLSRLPHLKPAQVEEALKATAVDLGWQGQDEEYGYGLLNAYELVNSTPSLKHRIVLLGDRSDPIRPGVETSVIPYYQASPGTVSLKIYDSAQQLVKTLTQTDPGATLHHHNFKWNGMNESDAPVPEGDYTYVLQIVDSQGILSETVTGGTITVTDTVAAVKNATLSKNPFASGGGNTTELSYELLKDSNVTIGIYDQNSTLVRTLTDKALQTTGTQKVLWDGKNNAGATVADGIYTYKITGTDLAGVALRQVIGSIALDNTVPVISNPIVTPNPFDPATAGLLSIKYDLSEDVKTTVGIYNASGTLVKTIANSVSSKAGANSVTWDGKNSAGVVVPFGTYRYQVQVTDAAGLSRTVSGPFPVDNKVVAGPVISGVSDTSDPLKVTGTTASTIYYTLSEAANVTLKVYNSSNVLVRTVLNNVAQTAGAKPAAWNGKNDEGVLVEDGTYTYKINAVNSAGRVAVEATGTITTDKTAPMVNNLVTTPNPFAPTGSNTMSFKYDLNEASKVTINIYDLSNVLVKTVANAVQNQAGSNSVTWDGRNGAGTIVPVGTYSYRMLVTDKVGLSRSISNYIAVKLTPTISNVSDTSDPLKVTGTTASTIYYTLSDAANVTVKVYNSNNVLVRTLLSNVAQTVGAKAVAWNGKNDAGLLVEDGTYRYKINAVNSAGVAAVEVSGTITTDKNAPTISNVVATPNPFVPTTSQLSFKYTLNEAAKVTVSIYNSSNVLVKTIASAAVNQTGTNSVVWDGKNNAGTFVPQGSYNYRILATDTVGLGRYVSGTFKVDTQAAVTAPVISAVSDTSDPLRLTGTTASTIYYTLSKPANVTIKVYDSANRLVRTLVDNLAQTAGAKPAAWDGRNDGGILVEDGIYTYKINAVDSAGVAAGEVTGTITTDKNAPIVSSLTATPNPFRPVTDHTLRISYVLSEMAKVTVSIYNSSNVLVKTVSSAVLNQVGSNSVTWDGKDSTGTRVPIGAYSYRLLATDIAGLSKSSSGVFKVE